MNALKKLSTSLAPLGARWQQLAPRERLMVLAAGALVLLALLWWIGLAPALRLLREAESQHRNLDRQLQTMQQLTQQATTLQSLPKASYDDALRALEAATQQRLGAGGRLVVAGDRATVTLKGVPADALAGWLAQARINARALPAEAHLTRTPAAAGTPAWDGTLVLTLPVR